MLEDQLSPYIPFRFLHDERYQKGHIHIINPLPGVKIMGVHIPDLRKLAAKLVRDGQAEELIRQFELLQAADPRKGLCYEEKMLWGMMLNQMRLPLEKRLEGFRTFIPTIDNWAVCDSVCSGAKWCKKNREEVWQFLQPWFRSQREFEVRFALVFSLAHFIDADHLPLLFDHIATLPYDQIQSEYAPADCRTSDDQGTVLGTVPYYVNMAAAWLMATALYKFPEQTRAFAASGKCPCVILKLYIRKARESFRTRNTNPK